ncbi:hypothetical protein BJ875DRAFT_438757 [Amylocarpus encephaloides]|uniref:Uncharacterized protein n=1 Tax=Amylocarpus encephaloides TaxID=45428 RepID=A0A9P8C9G2_9HELO|nr:hypothetical protein BJ875DRAFT_438757 [Amylocarpus encephaloides]
MHLSTSIAARAYRQAGRRTGSFVVRRSSRRDSSIGRTRHASRALSWTGAANTARRASFTRPYDVGKPQRVRARTPGSETRLVVGAWREVKNHVPRSCWMSILAVDGRHDVEGGLASQGSAGQLRRPKPPILSNPLSVYPLVADGLASSLHAMDKIPTSWPPTFSRPNRPWCYAPSWASGLAVRPLPVAQPTPGLRWTSIERGRVGDISMPYRYITVWRDTFQTKTNGPPRAPYFVEPRGEDVTDPTFPDAGGGGSRASRWGRGMAWHGMAWRQARSGQAAHRNDASAAEPSLVVVNGDWPVLTVPSHRPHSRPMSMRGRGRRESPCEYLTTDSLLLCLRSHGTTRSSPGTRCPPPIPSNAGIDCGSRHRGRVEPQSLRVAALVETAAASSPSPLGSKSRSLLQTQDAKLAGTAQYKQKPDLETQTTDEAQHGTTCRRAPEAEAHPSRVRCRRRI